MTVPPDSAPTTSSSMLTTQQWSVSSVTMMSLHIGWRWSSVQLGENPTTLTSMREKMEEMVIDFRRSGNRHHIPLMINGAAVERVSNEKFLGGYLSDELTSTINTTAVVKKAHLQLHPLWRLLTSSPSTGAPWKAS